MTPTSSALNSSTKNHEECHANQVRLSPGTKNAKLQPLLDECKDGESEHLLSLLKADTEEPQSDGDSTLREQPSLVLAGRIVAQESATYITESSSLDELIGTTRSEVRRLRSFVSATLSICDLFGMRDFIATRSDCVRLHGWELTLRYIM